MSEDKKTANVTVFSNFDNGATYEVSVKGYEEVVTFVASCGAPKTMTISSESKMQNGLLITTWKEEKLTYRLFDEFGNDVTNTITPTYVAFYATENSADYYVTGDIIYITKAGTQASVTAEFHYYDELAVDQVIKATNVFVGVDKAPDEIVSVSLVPHRYTTTYPNNNISMTYNKDIELEFKLKTSVEGDWDQKYQIGNPIPNLGNFGGVTVPVVRMRSTNPDVLDVIPGYNRNGSLIDTMELFKEGTSTVLVELVNKNADNTDRVTTVAAVTITVVPKGVVSKIDVYGSITAGTVDIADYDKGQVGIAAKDQYGNLHDVAQRPNFEEVKFADGKAISAGAVTKQDRAWYNGWTDQVVVDGSILLGDMVAAGYLTIDGDGEWYVAGRKVNQITKTITIKANVWCAPDYPNVDFNVNVTLKKPIAGISNYYVEASGATSGNVARYDDPYDGNSSTEDAKAVTFKLFTKSNDVKVAQWDMDIKPKYNAIASGAAVGSFWFTLTRDGADIADLDASVLSVDGDGTVTLNLSTLEAAQGTAAGGQQVVYKANSAAGYKKDLGAGRYTITVYRLVENEAGVQSYAYVGTNSVSVSTDFGGSYKYVKRLVEKVDSVDQTSLRNCFEFTNRSGQKAENAKYYVDYVDANGYVHVKSVTFYEELTGYAGVYAPYTVNVNVSLKK